MIRRLIQKTPPWAHTLWQTLVGAEALWFVANVAKVQSVHDAGEMERLALSAGAAGLAAVASKLMHVLKDSRLGQDDPEVVAAIDAVVAKYLTTPGSTSSGGVTVINQTITGPAMTAVETVSAGVTEDQEAKLAGAHRAPEASPSTPGLPDVGP